MKRNRVIGIAGVMLCAGLAACSSTPPRDTQELSQKTVQYNCGTGPTQPLSVTYTFQGTEPLAAKIIYQNQAVDLTRVTASNVDVVGNTFRGNGYTWTTDKFVLASAGAVNGNMLTQDVQQVVNGQTAHVSNILVKDCRVAAVAPG